MTEHFPRVIAVKGRGITYHFVQNSDEALRAIKDTKGHVVGSFPTSHFLEHEKEIQTYLKEKYG